MPTKNQLTASLAAVLLAGTTLSAAAYAQGDSAPGYKAESPVVVERGPNGRATAVRIDRVVYRVCDNEREDGCIQPRAAGLGWGDRPLQHWPGERGGKRYKPAEPAGPTGR